MFKQQLIEALTVVALIGLSVAGGFTGYFVAKVLLSIPVIGVIFRVVVSIVVVFAVAVIIAGSAVRIRDAYREHKRVQKDVEEEAQ
ncbi:hypothetical protein MH050_19210 [Bacillus licheniformis]|uniref:hypothetical protein n=1 Tax=Bacillus licheniformis TaxID=1402 RepID=UPI001CD6060E|nr:hypothetical protein [Bacillus licheniformis]MCA1184557.1 hypothetical protein [Bacillus licheniformis]MCY7742941.1 hypothetical protein [Bacillus licheniformis]